MANMADDIDSNVLLPTRPPSFRLFSELPEAVMLAVGSNSSTVCFPCPSGGGVGGVEA